MASSETYETEQLIRDVMTYVAFSAEANSGIYRVRIPVDHWDEFKEEFGTEWEGIRFVYDEHASEARAECKIKPGLGGSSNFWRRYRQQ